MCFDLTVMGGCQLLLIFVICIVIRTKVNYFGICDIYGVFCGVCNIYGIFCGVFVSQISNWLYFFVVKLQSDLIKKLKYTSRIENM
jgi:hypothetical protein